MEKIMAHQNTTAQEKVTSVRTEFPSRALMAEAETWASTMAEYQQEVGRFISDRLNKDGEAIRRTLASGNWTDAVGIQAQWVEEAVRDYNAEMSKLSGLYSKRAA